MFNKNNTKINSESEISISAKFHTMKDDISEKSEVNSIPENKTYNNPEELAETKRSSPFLSNEVPMAKKTKETAVNVEDTDVSKTEEKKSGFPNFEKINEENNASRNIENSQKYETFEYTNERKSSWIYFVVILLVLLLGGGGYYFWFMNEERSINEIFSDLTQKWTAVDLGDTVGNNSNNSGSGIINDLSGNKDGFSDKVNFMVINDENLDQAGIKSAIDDKFVEMEEYTDGQLEFLIVDQSNKPLAFKDFAENFNLILGPEIINNISGDNFSLFLYKKGDIKRLNLVVNVKNEDLLRMSLAKSEKTLANNLKSLFMYAQPDPSIKNSFGESNYNGQLVRYVNLNKNPDLSLDYSIVGNYLIIATNKESGRLIIDKLSRESTPNEDVFSPEN